MPASPRPSTCTGACIPGEMDRYAHWLGSAAEDTVKAKIRPEDNKDEDDEE